MLTYSLNNFISFGGLSIFKSIGKELLAFLMLIFVLGASAGGVLAVDFKTYLKGAQAEILSHKSSIRDDPLDEVAFFELGKAYLALGRHEEEIAAYQEAVKLNSQYSAAHFNLSMAYDLLKDGPNAIKHMLRAQDLYIEERKHAQIRKVQRQLKFFYLKYQRKSIIP